MIKTMEFTSDGYRLIGTLHLPEALPAPMVIGCHGLIADRNSPKQTALAKACCRRGIGYFRFDHRGCGDSRREFDQVASLPERSRDLSDALRLVRSLDACSGDLGLFGSSMGGAVCLAVCDTEEVAAVVTFAAPLHSRFSPAGDHPLSSPFDITASMHKVKNILVIHGACDEVVPVSHARSLYEHASRPKKMIIQSGGDHRMSDPGHQSAFIRESVAWFANVLL
jgi:uncharacterized protein